MRWLTPGGLLASAAVGAAVFWGLGVSGFILLVTFFVTGSLLTQITGGAGGRRTTRQVLANGAVAATAVLGSWPAAAGALAAAMADTWATEIGSFSRTPPQLITTGATVTAGTSGGVTMLGTAGGVIGAAVIGILAGTLGPVGLRGAFTITAAGVAGMMIDSVLGATAQAKWARFDNDAVNLATTIAGGGIGVLLFVII